MAKSVAPWVLVIVIVIAAVLIASAYVLTKTTKATTTTPTSPTTLVSPTSVIPPPPANEVYLSNAQYATIVAPGYVYTASNHSGDGLNAWIVSQYKDPGELVGNVTGAWTANYTSARSSRESFETVLQGKDAQGLYNYFLRNTTGEDDLMSGQQESGFVYTTFSMTTDGITIYYLIGWKDAYTVTFVETSHPFNSTQVASFVSAEV